MSVKTIYGARTQNICAGTGTAESVSVNLWCRMCVCFLHLAAPFTEKTRTQPQHESQESQPPLCLIHFPFSFFTLSRL